jgi:HD-GYP domain-containing protein (c-di-GMP phosphodiesterase class II)
MFFQFLFGLFLCVSAGLGTALAVQVVRSGKRMKSYRLALEAAQKQAEVQTSRLNLLCRALPNIPSILALTGDGWHGQVLDDLRALLWADGAAFWSFVENERALEFQSSRGLEPETAGKRLRIDVDEEPICQSARSLIPVVRVEQDIVSEPGSLIALPLVVGPQVFGVIKLSRKGGAPFNAADADLAHMFIRVLAVALENRTMVTNRERFYLELVQTLADILDSRDASNAGQTKRARRLARAIAEEMEMPAEFIHYLEFAALMHDIGKIAIDEALLRKPSKLTDQEFEVIKKHPELGYKILKPVTMLAPVAPMVLYHQEWFNGKGYPEGLSGEEIPLGARIVAILDAWCAMTSNRPWRPALSVEEAVREITKGSGTQFDPRVVDAFLAVIERESALAEAS